MDEDEFEGTLVLEILAAAGAVDEFYQAVDNDDFSAAASIMRSAEVDNESIQIVLKKMQEANSG